MEARTCLSGQESASVGRSEVGRGLGLHVMWISVLRSRRQLRETNCLRWRLRVKCTTYAAGLRGLVRSQANLCFQPDGLRSAATTVRLAPLRRPSSRGRLATRFAGRSPLLESAAKKGNRTSLSSTQRFTRVVSVAVRKGTRPKLQAGESCWRHEFQSVRKFFGSRDR